MIIQIEPQSDVAIYKQITNQLIEGIARGHLRHGDSLPSVRAFAADLGVNMHTVNKSYHELEKRGIIKIVPKSGAVIEAQTNLLQGSPHAERIQHELKTVIAEALVLGMKTEQLEQELAMIMEDLKHNKQ
ncbi:GntR family transcriptional regulator [Mesobacillus maritimus]|uniref:GntR family transcriptional regulator n=1 Tax=Mesobacillus maritimus TaxID=1643336 RepID=UPI00203FF2B4|nr:GntR family transcriptional regulator [Mesobacillus maritimus]MCM3668194.1 GntR family transcriptional regulator [Mesobacillus maritimus]